MAEQQLQKDFEEAVARIGGGKGGAKDSDKLTLYGFYKQATVGPVNVPRPGMFDFVGKAKWDAWHALGDMSREDAMRGYIAKADTLVPPPPKPAADDTESSSAAKETKPAKKAETWVVFSQNVIGAEQENDENSGEDQGDASFWDAVFNGDISTVLEALQAWKGDKDGPRRADGATVLMTACDRSQLDLVKALIEHNVGGNVNAHDKEGSTALHVAYTIDEPEIVQYLISHGADTQARDNDGCTPEELAS